MSAVLSKNKTRSTQKMCQVSKTYLKLAVDGRALVHGDLGLDERGHVVNIRDAGVVRGRVGADARLVRRDEELFACDCLCEKRRGKCRC